MNARSGRAHIAICADKHPIGVRLKMLRNCLGEVVYGPLVDDRVIDEIGKLVERHSIFPPESAFRI